MQTPRKLVRMALFAATAALSLFVTACSSCGNSCNTSCQPMMQYENCAPTCETVRPTSCGNTSSGNIRSPFAIAKEQVNHLSVKTGSYHPITPCGPSPSDCGPCAPKTPAVSGCSNVVTINTDLIRITKRYPEAVELNQEFAVEMTATALDNATSIVITESVPKGLMFVRADSGVSSRATEAVWTIDSLRKGQSKVIKVWFKATELGELCGCTTVTAVPYICAPVFVGQACLTCKKTGPSRVNCDDEIEFMITVSNTGTAVARDVLVTENLPAEVEHASGQRVLRFPLGDLQPKETKQFCVRVKAKTRCVKVCNKITTTSANCEGSGCECCLDICKSIVSIRKSGPGEQYICKNADYQIVIKNEGDNILHNVTVTDVAPAGTQIVMAPGANVSGNNAVWSLRTLGANEEQVFNIKLTSKNCGTYCNKALVRASDGCGADTELCTVWKGCCGITMCVTDCEDPVCVGQCNTYRVIVHNQGVVPDLNVSITGLFSAELQPISGSGPTACTVNGQTVTFKPIASLGPKQTAEFLIRAKAMSPGDARLKVQLMSDFLTKPVTDEESTQIY